MCGIAGILDLRPDRTVSRPVLERMTRALAHRGPDNQGLFIEGNLGLGHRRLAVIDPSPAGNQPMVTPDGELAVCFNGTIYNFRELRVELEAAGHEFVSNCDTEVLLHGWKQWGESLVERLNGHFAFMLWSKPDNKLFLVRDRFGTKPLYFAKLGDLWLFGSEIKAILAHPEYTPDVNLEALYEYFSFQNLFRYHTLFDKVHLIPAANVASVDTRTGEFKRRLFWDYDYCFMDHGMDPIEASLEVKRLLIQAVKRQLVADVEVGAYLSGGLDSGSIVSIASREIERMSSFTCGWHMGGVEGVEASFDGAPRGRADVLPFQDRAFRAGGGA